MFFWDGVALLGVILLLAILMTWADKNKLPKNIRKMSKEELRKETKFHHKAGGGTFIDPD
jgi:hypothetical protein